MSVDLFHRFLQWLLQLIHHDASVAYFFLKLLKKQMNLD